MGRGWAEEKQIGVELQREGSAGRGVGKPGRQRVGSREMGGQCEKKSRLGKERLECRRNLGKEEVLKTRRTEEKENGVALEVGGRPQEATGAREPATEKLSG